MLSNRYTIDNVDKTVANVRNLLDMAVGVAIGIERSGDDAADVELNQVESALILSRDILERVGADITANYADLLPPERPSPGPDDMLFYSISCYRASKAEFDVQTAHTTDDRALADARNRTFGPMINMLETEPPPATNLKSALAGLEFVVEEIGNFVPTAGHLAILRSCAAVLRQETEQ